MKKIILILANAFLFGCSKEEGYTLKKYHYKVYAGGFNCNVLVTHDGITEDLSHSGYIPIEFDSRRSFEVKFSPTRSTYSYELYVERENTWHQKEVHSIGDGYKGEKTYIVK